MQPPSWPSIRAALIAVVIAVNALMASPSPARLSERHFERVDAREEVDAWVELLGRLGLEVTPADLQHLAIDFTDRYVDVRSVLVGRPTRFARRWLGIRQNWALFARPDTWPTSLVIETRDGPGMPWIPRYRSLDETHRELEPQLRYRRVRGLYDFGETAGTAWPHLCRWIAAQQFDEHPRARRVRVRLVQAHVVRPGEPTDPAQRAVHTQVISRHQVGR